MNFNSFKFLEFLPVVFVIYWLIPHKFKWICLLISSYYFYMSWNTTYIILIFTTTFISYLTAVFIEKAEVEEIKMYSYISINNMFRNTFFLNW